MEYLPAETSSHIHSYLEPKDLLRLQLVSKTLLRQSRDDYIWRHLAYQSTRSNDYYRFRTNHLMAPSRGRSRLSSLQVADPRVTWAESSRDNPSPSLESEEIDWYSDYIARNAGIYLQWLEQPKTGVHRETDELGEVEGVGLLRQATYDGLSRAVAPLNDGSVCVWDYGQRLPSEHNESWGKILGRSEKAMLFKGKSRSSCSPASLSYYDFVNEGQCVNVDSRNLKAYMAVGNCVTEVDIPTLQVVSQQTFPWAVSAISKPTTGYEAALTVATTMDIHIYDPRHSGYIREGDEDCASSRYSSLNVSYESRTAPLRKPRPLTVLHPPAPNIHSIFVAGTFPTILLYDRRYLPRMQDIVYSGAINRELSVVQEVYPGKNYHEDVWKGHHGLIACGNREAIASLDMFSITGTPPRSDPVEPTSINKLKVDFHRLREAPTLYSVANHGSRVVTADSVGNIHWFERDIDTPVRVFNLNRDPQSRSRRLGVRRVCRDVGGRPSIHLKMGFNGRVEHARRLIPTGGALLEDEILFWTGERLGSLGFHPYPHRYDDEDDPVWWQETLEQRRREKLYLDDLDYKMQTQPGEDWYKYIPRSAASQVIGPR